MTLLAAHAAEDPAAAGGGPASGALRTPAPGDGAGDAAGLAALRGAEAAVRGCAGRRPAAGRGGRQGRLSPGGPGPRTGSSRTSAPNPHEECQPVQRRTGRLLWSRGAASAAGGGPGGAVALVDRVWPETGPVTACSRTSVFAGFRFPREVISLAVRWYLRYGLSYRDVEELLAERGVTVDHVTIYRWVQRFIPEFIEAARPCRRAAHR